jgi:hypothetical protein
MQIKWVGWSRIGHFNDATKPGDFGQAKEVVLLFLLS